MGTGTLAPMSNSDPARLVHLVRHGEVDNPHHVVYADLPGFGLSALGREQGAETALHLAAQPVRRVLASPLQRAIETAGFIAARHGIGVIIDDRLTEWRLSMLWAGIVWEELDEVRPGELAAYLSNPADLPFSPESLESLGTRVAAAAADHALEAGGDLVVVSHQDPIHAAARVLTGAGLQDFGSDKPGHATVVSLDPSSDPWHLRRRFDPIQGPRFPPPDDRSPRHPPNG